MAARIMFLCLTLTLVGGPLTSQSQPVQSDTDVSRGIALVEEGEYDAAILTLDRAARRLSEDPDNADLLSQAYLYLGVAFMGKGHEAAAKAKFRDAIRQLRDLSLSPEEFPPKVIEVFESAKEEVDESEAAPAGVGEAKSGSKMPYILLGAGGAGAAGVILALSGGDSESDGENYEFFHGLLRQGDDWAMATAGPGGAGRWTAEITWTNPSVVYIDVTDMSNDEWVTGGRLLSDTSRIAEWNGVAGATYRFDINWDYDESSTEPGAYELTVTYPNP